MVIKTFRGLLLITITILNIGAKCNKDKTIPCPNLKTAYNFHVSSQLTPETEIYSVGDTIYLTSMFPKKLIDPINPSIIINYANSAVYGGKIGLVYLDSITHQFIPAIDSFKFVDIEGRFLESANLQNRTKNIVFIELSDKYKFVGGVICTKRGVYEINVDNLYSPGIKGTKCTSASFSMEVSNGNKNINLFQAATGLMPTLGRQKIMYCFRVK